MPAQQTVASAGNQHLNGATAAAYATYLVSGEPEQSRLARFATVLGALLPKLPAGRRPGRSCSPASARTARRRSRPPALGDFLGGLRADAVADRLGFDTLPTHALDLGTGTPTLVVDPQGAADAGQRELLRLAPGHPARRPDQRA